MLYEVHHHRPCQAGLLCRGFARWVAPTVCQTRAFGDPVVEHGAKVSHKSPTACGETHKNTGGRGGSQTDDIVYSLQVEFESRSCMDFPIPEGPVVCDPILPDGQHEL
jgi:hypothetical protein